MTVELIKDLEKKYPAIEEKMRYWRRGYESYPEEYTEYHKELAAIYLAELVKQGIKVHNQWMDGDGWGGSFKATWLIIEMPDGALLKIYWSDSHSKGCWFLYTNSGSTGFQTYLDKYNKEKNKKFYIVYDRSNHGYSIGNHCEDCLSKAKNNAKITGKELGIEERKSSDNCRCVFCGATSY